MKKILLIVVALSMSAMAEENFAKIYVKGTSKNRVKKGNNIFNYKIWNEIPEFINGKRATFRDQGAPDEPWDTKLELKVKENGDVIAVIMATSFAKFKNDGWEKIESGNYIDSNGIKKNFIVIKKHFDLGKYTLPLGDWFFPVVLIYMH